jgi:5-methylthioadenosine/S-adenosylhomocysteine deaminase
MKTMSLLQKGIRNNPSILPADEVLGVATRNGRKALRLNDNDIKTGNVADFIIIKLNKQIFKNIDIFNSTPTQRHTEFLNRLIYAGNGNYVSQTITQ